MAEVLGVPSGVVINRSLGDDGIILNLCRDKNLPVLMTIPFDRDIAEAANSGKLVADVMPEMKGRFEELFSRACSLGGVK